MTLPDLVKNDMSLLLQQNALPQLPFTRQIHLLRTYVAGSGYVEEIVIRIQALSEGDRLLLVREPENPYDERAILVENLEGEKLGYIPRRKNEVLASLMDAGKSIYARVCHLEDPEEDLPVSGYMDIDVYMDD